MTAWGEGKCRSVREDKRDPYHFSFSLITDEETRKLLQVGIQRSVPLICVVRTDGFEGLDGELVVPLGRVDWTSGIVRILHCQMGFDELMEREATNCLARVWRVRFPVLITNEIHDRPCAKQRVVGFAPALFRRQIGKSKEYKSRAFVASLRIHAEGL